MPHLPERRLKTGGDPRALPDYAALRAELNKLTHPARPDVNWHHAEKNCLSLFAQNGAELQTAAWYTLARTHLDALHGLNEGLAILEALLTHQWPAVWPQQVDARMEIISGLSKRLQQVMRAFTFSHADLAHLYQAEHYLASLGRVLQRLDLKHASRMDELRHQLHNAAIKLENSDPADPNAAGTGAGVALSACSPHLVARTEFRANNLAKGTPQQVGTKWVYVVPPVPGAKVAAIAAQPAPATAWKAFSAGVMMSLLAGGLLLWGHYSLDTNPDRDSLMASVAPLTSTLADSQLQALRQVNPSWLAGSEKYERQVEASALPTANATFGRLTISPMGNMGLESKLEHSAE
ncbi:type VI secretion system ImpA family N-terminal domain-containing protein [Acerihabitans arboris]|uniref:ImpA N-terminal domain-containing protein n=1 Tax=Acerihabitans arboris TaxID=2691583 RepID=A0A845SLT4_9GAMM|nr:type VI secretion system ImpA family N-terminal domain-containing protein [Acerihabitans arboris]NDL64197.1 hypothetical protein [Acerihabitans arboris]